MSLIPPHSGPNTRPKSGSGSACPAFYLKSAGCRLQQLIEQSAFHVRFITTAWRAGVEGRALGLSAGCCNEYATGILTATLVCCHRQARPATTNMEAFMTKREFLSASFGTGLALAKGPLPCPAVAGRHAQGTTGNRGIGGRRPEWRKQPSCSKAPQRISRTDCRHAGGVVDRASKRCPAPKPRSYHLPEPKSLDGKRLAGGLEWQAAEDGDDAFPKHERDGCRRRVCLDGRECAPGRRFSGGHELQAGQPSADPARSGRMTAGVATARCGTTASCGSRPCGCAAICASTPRRGSRNS